VDISRIDELTDGSVDRTEVLRRLFKLTHVEKPTASLGLLFHPEKDSIHHRSVADLDEAEKRVAVELLYLHDVKTQFFQRLRGDREEYYRPDRRYDAPYSGSLMEAVMSGAEHLFLIADDHGGEVERYREGELFEVTWTGKTPSWQEEN